jgi:hypothetical protein
MYTIACHAPIVPHDKDVERSRQAFLSDKLSKEIPQDCGERDLRKVEAAQSNKAPRR